MRKLIQFLFSFFLFYSFSISVTAQESESLISEMTRLGVDSALIFPIQGVDDYPVWSPEKDFLANKVSGKWFKVDLNHIKLVDGAWRENQKIGVIDSAESVSAASNTEVEQWKKSKSIRGSRIVKTTSGATIELRAEGLSTSLVVTPKGQSPIVYWTSGLENCHSLVLSPDEKYVAFIAELNGVVIFDFNLIHTK